MLTLQNVNPHNIRGNEVPCRRSALADCSFFLSFFLKPRSESTYNNNMGVLGLCFEDQMAPNILIFGLSACLPIHPSLSPYSLCMLPVSLTGHLTAML